MKKIKMMILGLGIIIPQHCHVLKIRVKRNCRTATLANAVTGGEKK